MSARSRKAPSVGTQFRVLAESSRATIPHVVRPHLTGRECNRACMARSDRCQHRSLHPQDDTGSRDVPPWSANGARLVRWRRFQTYGRVLPQIGRPSRGCVGPSCVFLLKIPTRPRTSAPIASQGSRQGCVDAHRGHPERSPDLCGGSGGLNSFPSWG